MLNPAFSLIRTTFQEPEQRFVNYNDYIIFAIYNDVCSTKNIQKISYYGRYDAAPRAVGLKRENR